MAQEANEEIKELYLEALKYSLEQPWMRQALKQGAKEGIKEWLTEATTNATRRLIGLVIGGALSAIVFFLMRMLIL